ncbi:MAG: hypothetical protein ACRDGP_04370 [Actinomycetota bacterium]
MVGVTRWVLLPAVAFFLAMTPAVLGLVEAVRRTDMFWNLVYPAFVLAGPFLAGLFAPRSCWKHSGLAGLATVLGFFPSYIALVWFYGLSEGPLSSSDRGNVFAMVILVPPGVLLFAAISRLGSRLGDRLAARKEDRARDSP